MFCMIIIHKVSNFLKIVKKSYSTSAVHYLRVKTYV